MMQVHVNRSEPSLSLAFDYAEHDLYEIIWHHRDRLAGAVTVMMPHFTLICMLSLLGMQWHH
jgi:hypothetical protein